MINEFSADGSAPRRRSQLQRSAAALTLAAFFLSVIATPGYSGTMALPGEDTVGPNGTASYSIPIATPPGTAGVAPRLSLSYSSASVQGGNGLLGVGWSLAGLPSIARCAKTFAQDGALRGVNFDGNDRFCLDGQRLVAISGTYGADGTEYRTEIDSYSKIISHGTAGSGPAWFEVRTKAGQIMEFGHTTDSLILAQGKSSARAWALNKLSDTKSNYLTVSYTNDTTNGQYHPVEINYTGNTAASVAPTNKVQFGTRFTFRHDGQFKNAFITRTGPDSFTFTSASRSGNRIFTHMDGVSTQYLRNIGVTLPRGF